MLQAHEDFIILSPESDRLESGHNHASRRPDEPRRIGESDSDHRMKESWETLIRRAELLTFYAGLLRAQQDIYESLRRRKDWLPSGALADDLPVIRVMTRGLLQTVEARAPELLAVEARDLLLADGRTLDE